jgi:hypothetical protein
MQIDVSPRDGQNVSSYLIRATSEEEVIENVFRCVRREAINDGMERASTEYVMSADRIARVFLQIWKERVSLQRKLEGKDGGIWSLPNEMRMKVAKMRGGFLLG